MFPVVMSFSPDIRRPFLAAFTGKRILARQYCFAGRGDVIDLSLKKLSFEAVETKKRRCGLSFVTGEYSYDTQIFLPQATAKDYILTFPDFKKDRLELLPTVWVNRWEESPWPRIHRLRFFVGFHAGCWLLVRVLYVGSDAGVYYKTVNIKLPWKQEVHRFYIWDANDAPE